MDSIRYAFSSLVSLFDPRSAKGEGSAQGDLRTGQRPPAEMLAEPGTPLTARKVQQMPGEATARRELATGTQASSATVVDGGSPAETASNRTPVEAAVDDLLAAEKSGLMEVLSYTHGSLSGAEDMAARAGELLKAADQTRSRPFVEYCIGQAFGAKGMTESELVALLQEFEPGRSAPEGADPLQAARTGLQFARDPFRLLKHGPESLGMKATRHELSRLGADPGAQNGWKHHLVGLLQANDRGWSPQKKLERVMLLHEECVREAKALESHGGYQTTVFTGLAEVAVEALEALFESQRPVTSSEPGGKAVSARTTRNDAALEKEAQRTLELLVEPFLTLWGIKKEKSTYVALNGTRLLPNISAFDASYIRLKNAPTPHSAPRAALLELYAELSSALQAEADWRTISWESTVGR